MLPAQPHHPTLLWMRAASEGAYVGRATGAGRIGYVSVNEETRRRGRSYEKRCERGFTALEAGYSSLRG